jgi:hypothetical protein
MRVRLKGIHTAMVKRADGAKRTYHYAWRGGPAPCRQARFAGIRHQLLRRALDAPRTDPLDLPFDYRRLQS